MKKRVGNKLPTLLAGLRGDGDWAAGDSWQQRIPAAGMRDCVLSQRISRAMISFCTSEVPS